KAGSTIPRKGEIRIDLLCAAVCQNYETKFPTKRRITYGPLLAAQPLIRQSNSADKAPQLASHTAVRRSAQSGSILIVDDTHPDVPAMSGALPVPENHVGFRHDAFGPHLAVPGGQSILSVDRGASLDAVATQRSSNVLGNEMDLPSAEG